MKKIISLIFLLLLYSCNNNIINDTKEFFQNHSENTPIGNNILLESDGKDIVLKFNENTSIETYLTYSSQACYGGDIYLKNKDKKTIIFESRIPEINIFPYCSAKIEKISEESAHIYICHQPGGGSGECGAILFQYDLNNNLWNYINHGYYSTIDNQEYSYNLNNTSNTVPEVNGLLEYMKNKGYSVTKK